MVVPPRFQAHANPSPPTPTPTPTQNMQHTTQAYESALHSKLGVPLDFDDLMTSMVYAPQDVPGR